MLFSAASSTLFCRNWKVNCISSMRPRSSRKSWIAAPLRHSAAPLRECCLLYQRARERGVFIKMRLRALTSVFFRPLSLFLSEWQVEPCLHLTPFPLTTGPASFLFFLALIAPCLHACRFLSPHVVNRKTPKLVGKKKGCRRIFLLGWVSNGEKKHWKQTAHTEQFIWPFAGRAPPPQSHTQRCICLAQNVPGHSAQCASTPIKHSAVGNSSCLNHLFVCWSPTLTLRARPCREASGLYNKPAS